MFLYHFSSILASQGKQDTYLFSLALLFSLPLSFLPASFPSVAGSFPGQFLLALCVSLNENGSHKYIYLNMGCSVGGAVWEGIRGVALLEMSHWGCLCHGVFFFYSNRNPNNEPSITYSKYISDFSHCYDQISAKKKNILREDRLHF